MYEPTCIGKCQCLPVCTYCDCVGGLPTTWLIFKQWHVTGKMLCSCRPCVRFPLVSVLADSSWLWVSYARPLKWQARSILPGVNLKRCQKVTGCKHLDDWLQCSPVSLHYLNLPPPASIHHVLFSASAGHLHGHQDDSIRGLQTLQWQRIRPINGIK